MKTLDDGANLNEGNAIELDKKQLTLNGSGKRLMEGRDLRSTNSEYV